MTTYGRGKHPNCRIGRDAGHALRKNSLDKILDRCVADLVTDCVLWSGSTSKKGYGRTSWNGRLDPVHRIVYEQLVGPIPAGLTLDHICEIKCCVNPDHLEPVTNAENVKRYYARGDRRVRRG